MTKADIELFFERGQIALMSGSDASGHGLSRVPAG
jgi:hypothetical protein